LILTGGLIGAFSSLATLALNYVLEGMRLRRQWQRDDQLLLRQKRDEIQQLLTRAAQPSPKNEADPQI